MISYLRDRLATVRLKARYERVMRERMCSLIEESGPQRVVEDSGNWMLLGDGTAAVSESERVDLRARARQLVRENPHARHLLRLLEIYVVGPGLRLSHAATRAGDDVAELATEADRAWAEFLAANGRHFSYREYARRVWRDGECFLRKFASAGLGSPSVRFVDPETIGPTREQPDSQGVITDADDVETVLAYLRIDPASGELLEEIAADDMFHTRIGVDSNQKRGVTLFGPVIECVSRFDRWLETELLARKLQASIVLWRKVQGSPSQATAVADGAQTSGPVWPDGVRRERYRAGTILTTSQGTELQYLQPNTNFGDAVPLGRLLLLCLSAGAGLPEFMLTSDASNANYASTMVAEGPAVKLFRSEQEFFAREFERIWRWVMDEAIAAGRLPADVFQRIRPEWTFPELVTRDRPRERVADARLVEARVLSRAEVARRDGADPGVMRDELASEEDLSRHGGGRRAEG